MITTLLNIVETLWKDLFKKSEAQINHEAYQDRLAQMHSDLDPETEFALRKHIEHVYNPENYNRAIASCLKTKYSEMKCVVCFNQECSCKF